MYQPSLLALSQLSPCNPLAISFLFKYSPCCLLSKTAESQYCSLKAVADQISVAVLNLAFSHGLHCPWAGSALFNRIVTIVTHQPTEAKTQISQNWTRIKPVCDFSLSSST